MEIEKIESLNNKILELKNNKYLFNNKISPSKNEIPNVENNLEIRFKDLKNLFNSTILNYNNKFENLENEIEKISNYYEKFNNENENNFNDSFDLTLSSKLLPFSVTPSIGKKILPNF